MDCLEKCENKNDKIKEALFAIADELKKYVGNTNQIFIAFK